MPVIPKRVHPIGQRASSNHDAVKMRAIMRTRELVVAVDATLAPATERFVGVLTQAAFALVHEDVTAVTHPGC